MPGVVKNGRPPQVFVGRRVRSIMVQRALFAFAAAAPPKAADSSNNALQETDFEQPEQFS